MTPLESSLQKGKFLLWPPDVCLFSYLFKLYVVNLNQVMACLAYLFLTVEFGGKNEVNFTFFQMKTCLTTSTKLLIDTLK